MTGEDLIGTWRLWSFAFTDEAGAVFHPLGERPAGFVLISADGYLALNFMAGERSRFADDDLFGGDETERARAASEIVSFAGPYEFDGNAVSVTTTLNSWYGSKVTVTGAGFVLNNEMDDFSAKQGVKNMYGVVGNARNAIEPGKRMLSSMTPTILLKDKKPALIIGTTGGSTIFTQVFQVILNLDDRF